MMHNGGTMDYIEKFEELINGSDCCFISYIDQFSYPVTKAMLMPRERDGVKTIIFSTNTSSNKVKSFRKNPRASIYFMDRIGYRGLCLSGHIAVDETPEMRKRIWRNGDELYYKSGIMDPDYCVLIFTAERGRYYSNFQSVDFDL